MFLLPVLIAGLGLILAGRVTAQTLKTLYSFSATSDYPYYTNSDGVMPWAGLTLSCNTLYGTAGHGGTSGYGTVFAVNTDGTGFTNLHNFSAIPSGTNSDGAVPIGGLILLGNTLYGTTHGGGSSGNGTVFAINTDGTGFTNLYSFTALSSAYGSNSDGAHPDAGLILSCNTLYGTAVWGGSSGRGTVFAVNTDGTGFTNLHSFTALSDVNSGTNSDGANPYAGLILSGGTLYGTAAWGGSSDVGAVFAVNTNGTGFTNLHSFTYDSEVAYPYAGLVLSGNTLYGTATFGVSPAEGYGSVFAVNTDGTGFTNLHNFSYNDDASGPEAGLVLSGNTLYGTTYSETSSGNGTVFAVNTDGTGFTILHTFAGPPSEGANPYAGLILSGNTLYGTTFYGGSSDYGTVFSLSFTPQLTIIPSGGNVVLTWPTNVAGFDYSGFTLQSTTNLVSPVVWDTNVPAPVVVNGQNTVTNPISGAQQFYRLSQ